MQGKKINFTDEQLAWLSAHFADTKNAELAARLGCGESTLHRVARRLGLKKSREFMAGVNRASLEACWQANKGEGNHGKKNLVVHGVRYRFKKGERPIDRLGAEGEAKRCEKLKATRQRLIRRERLRQKWGLPQLTNIKLGCRKEHIPMRYALKKRGYIVSRGAKVIYYDDSTRRSAVVERHAEKKGLQLFPYDPVDEFNQIMVETFGKGGEQ